MIFDNVNEIILAASSFDEYSNILSDYSDAIKAYCNDGITFYRGMTSNSQNIFEIITPKQRKSITNSNFHTVMFSQYLSSWKNYPKRSHCIICSLNSYEHSAMFGNDIYVVFPKNNAKIAVCPNIDFHWSFEAYPNDITNLAYDLMKIVKGFLHIINNSKNGQIKEKFSDTFISQIKKLNYDVFKLNGTELKKYITCVDILFNAFRPIYTLEYLQQSFGNTMDNDELLNELYNSNYVKNKLSELFGPTENGFMLTQTNELEKLKNLKNKEVWFDDSALVFNLHSPQIDKINSRLHKFIDN